MFSKKSRYAKARKFSADTSNGDGFPGVRPREIGPAAGMIEHEVKVGDRLDHLARNYYNDDRLWWRIVDANPEFFYGQAYLKKKKSGDEDDHEPLVPVPGVMLLEHFEGSVILIPRLKES